MKIVRPWLLLLGIVVVALAVVLVRPATQPQAASRLSALGPSGQGSGPVGVDGSGVQGVEVVTSIKNDVSAPLASIPPIAPQQGALEADLNKLMPLPNRNHATARSDFRDPVLQEGPVSANIPAPLVSFDGVGNLFGGWPPDTNGDVGPNHYVQWINLSFAVYSKTGALLYGPAAGNTLWSGFGGICQTNNNGDPIVLYDHLADRWFMSQFALGFPNNFHQCIAVSQTSDPLGAWYRYDFLWGTKLNDYPKFGVWPDGYYMAVNQFNGTTFAWSGQGVAAFERGDMLAGLPATMVKFDLATTNINLGGMLPSDLDGATLPPVGAPNLFAEVDDDASLVFPDQLQLWAFHVDWVNTANSTFTNLINLPVAAFDGNLCNGARNCVPQPSTSAKLDTIADRLMFRLQYRNFGTHQTLVTNHTVDVDSTDRAGVRWYELRNTGSGWSIFQQGTFSPDSTDRWMASAAMNGLGEIAVGYSISSGSIFPSVRYTGRVPGDALGTLPQGEGTLMAGTGSQTDTLYSRWGDYSMMAVDPVDDCTFWFTSEYVQTTGTANWKTRIGSFQVSSCAGGPTPTPTATGPAPTFTPTPTATNTPTPAPGCTLNCMRVTAIDMRSTGSGVQARVTVRNENNAAVSGASVSVTWNLPGGGTQTQTGTTNAQGRVNFNVTGGSGTYTITVTNITKTGFTFDPANSTLLTKSLTK